MFRKFTVTLSFRDKILGGRPLSTDLLGEWLGTRDLKIAQGAEPHKVGRSELRDVKSREIKASSWNTFDRDDKGLFIEERNVKAMLREAGLVSSLGRRPGFANMIRNGVFCKPEKIRLLKDAANIKKPDGYIDLISHLKRSRSSSAIKRLDYVEKPQAKFEIWLSAIMLSDEDLQLLLTLGEEVGLGACRSQGYGKFNAHLEPLPESKA